MLALASDPGYGGSEQELQSKDDPGGQPRSQPNRWPLLSKCGYSERGRRAVTASDLVQILSPSRTSCVTLKK